MPGGSDISGRYRMLRRLAGGGMGEVYLAAASGPAGFAKLAVVKRILPHFAGDPDFVAMFVNEARLAAAIDHPNVVRVYDFGEASGSFFYAMEYLHGDSLAHLLPRASERPDKLPLAHALTIGLGVCAGLHYAHERRGPDGQLLKIVHRDVSPGNVFVTTEGEVKILDFGIARAMASTGVTRDGVRKGKVPYMSPEQCIGAPLDRRSDVFSIGIILYEMTTMTRLFRASNEFATMNMITTGIVVPPSRRVPGYPPALEAVVLKALRQDRDQRYATALELHEDLERVADELGLRTSSLQLGRWVRSIVGDLAYPSPDERGPDEDMTAIFFDAMNEALTTHQPVSDALAASLLAQPPPLPRPGEGAQPLPPLPPRPGGKAVSGTLSGPPPLPPTRAGRSAEASALPLPPLGPRVSAAPALPLPPLGPRAAPALPLPPLGPRASAAPARPTGAEAPTRVTAPPVEASLSRASAEAPTRVSSPALALSELSAGTAEAPTRVTAPPDDLAFGTAEAPTRVTPPDDLAFGTAEAPTRVTPPADLAFGTVEEVSIDLSPETGAPSVPPAPSASRPLDAETSASRPLAAESSVAMPTIDEQPVGARRGRRGALVVALVGGAAAAALVAFALTRPAADPVAAPEREPPKPVAAPPEPAPPPAIAPPVVPVVVGDPKNEPAAKDPPPPAEPVKPRGEARPRKKPPPAKKTNVLDSLRPSK